MTDLDKLLYEEARPPVTVGELREWLGTLPQDSLVMVPGYEGGYNWPPLVSRQELVVPEPSSFCGQFNDASRAPFSAEKPFLVIVIER